MKKLLLFVLLFSLFNITNAQDGKAILPFVEGKTLSTDDIGFLDLVSKGTSESARGIISEAMVDGSSYKQGQVLTKDNARAINMLIATYSEKAGKDVSDESKASVDDGKTRGCGYYCYYYYWDNWCHCYKYYWYYCCL